MTKANLVIGDTVVFRKWEDVLKEYPNTNSSGNPIVQDQVYTKEMYEEYKDYIFVIQRIEGDRLIFFKNHNGMWYRITKGMVKRIYKRGK